MNVTIDSSKFLKMLNNLSLISGVDVGDVLRHEAARVIETAIKYTPKAVVKFKTTAKEEAERRNSTFPDDGWPRISINKPKDYVWLGETDDALVEPHPHGKSKGLTRERVSSSHPVWHRMNDNTRRWNQRRWAAYKNLDAQRRRQRQVDLKIITAERKAIRQARGLTKRSWYQIGKDLNLPMRDIPNYVTGAKPSNGKEYKNGFGKKFRTWSGFLPSGFFYRLENNYPALLSGRITKKTKKGPLKTINGYAILQRAINARTRAFQVELKKGVFKDVKMRAARHPGVFVT